MVNPFNLDANYGPLGYDHTKVFNLSFSYKLPKPIHNNWALGELINGWQISNYTTYRRWSTLPGKFAEHEHELPAVPYSERCDDQHADYDAASAMPLQLTRQWPAITIATDVISEQHLAGHNQPQNGLQPLVVCDPRKGLLKDQYFNPNCFAAPLPPTATAFGQNGQTIWPYIRTPHYFGSDLAIFKAFRVNDSQRVEIRVSATNWLNHPNAQFGLAGNADNQLAVQRVSAPVRADLQLEHQHHRYSAKQGWISLDAVRSQILLLIRFRSVTDRGGGESHPFSFPHLDICSELLSS